MEARGAVNHYRPYPPGTAGAGFFTVNLAAGVTPFMRFVNGKEFSSECYRLLLIERRTMTIDQANYRPERQEFDALDRSGQDHVLNGGLLCAPFGKAVGLQMRNDPVERDWDYEKFQAWALEVYGKRRPPGGDRDPSLGPDVPGQPY